MHSEHNRPVISSDLKTKSARRDIPLPSVLTDCLWEAKETATSESVVANRDGDPLSYTQFKRVWQYIVTRSTKERTYVRYINGQKIQHTGTPKLGEKAAHNGNVVYSLDFSDNSALVALHIYHEFDLLRRRSENGSVSGRA